MLLGDGFEDDEEEGILDSEGPKKLVVNPPLGVTSLFEWGSILSGPILEFNFALN